MQNKALSALKQNEIGIIYDITAQESIRRRLQDIGFVPGNRVKCLFTSPFGDPTAYRVKNTVVALRSEDASKIVLK